jgi:hypothetical protein
MTRFSKSALLLGAALAVLSACSGTKGPGEIGTKEDIVVRNNGLPGAAKAPAPDADFSSTVEQAEAVPAPAVGAAEPLPDTSPAVETAAQQVADAKAPMPSTTTTPVSPVTDAKPIDQIAPQTPVQNTANIAPPAATTTSTDAPKTAPASAPISGYIPPAATAPPPTPAAPSSSVYPAADYPAASAPAPAVAPAPATVPVTSPNAYVPVPAGTAYPLDPNAPYSPKAMTGAAAPVTASQTAAAPVAAPVVPATGLNLSDPAVIRSAQTALKTKAGYTGEASGTVDAAFLNALTVYQGTNKLPVGGLNEATLRHLGVIE